MESLLIYESDSDDSDGATQPLSGTEGITTTEPPEPDRDRSIVDSSYPIQQKSISPVVPEVTLPTILPPPPEDLLPPGSEKWNGSSHGGRIRSFPHVEGNFALHVYIPVTLPSYGRNELGPLIDRALKVCPSLQVLEEDLVQPSVGTYAGTDSHSFGSSTRLRLGREYHISLSRTVPIRFQQIESITSMLRHKFSHQNGYVAGFDYWEVFTNDENTRTFLSLEITQLGLFEIQKQVALVDEVFRLHNLPSFYTNPRPHISLAWALGEVSSSVQTVANELNRVGSRKGTVWSSQVRKIDCKIGQRVYTIWASPS